MAIERKKQSYSSRYLTTLLGASSALSLIALAPIAVAQETSEETANEETENAESDLRQDVIVVSGFRRSLQDARDAKRNSQNIIDGISAEDIGKSSDQNIAEALQRVTGVSINRENGEGTTVTVRGVNADLNNVTINGVTVTSSGGDLLAGQGNQRVDFSSFSADLLSRIEVAKTASADHDEGSLGAAINLRTFKPLDAQKNRRIIDVQTRWSEFADDDGSLDLEDVFGRDGRISVSLSEKLMDDKLGLSLVAVTEKNSVRQDWDETTRYFAFNPGNGFNQNLLTLPGGVTNIVTGQNQTTFDYGDGQGERELFAHAPFEKQYQIHNNRLKRDSLTGTLQYRPTNQTDIQFDATYTETEREQNQFQFRIRPNNQNQEGDFNLFDPVTYDLVGFRRVANFNTRGSAHTNPGFVRPAENQRDTTDKNLILALDISHEWNEFEFNLRGGTSRTTSRDDNVFNSTYQIENQPDNNGTRPGSFNGFLRDANGVVTTTDHAGFFAGYDCLSLSHGGICPIVVSAENVANYDQSLGPVVDNPDSYTFGSLNFRDRNVDDKSASLFFDVDWNREFGPVKQIETGLKWSTRDRDQRQTNVNFTRFNPSVSSLFGLRLSEFHTGRFTPADFGQELGLPRDAITDGVPLPDADLLLARLEESQAIPRIINNPANQREFNLDVWSAYVKANFEFLDGRVFGDVGIRYSETETEAVQGGGIILNTAQFTQDDRNLTAFGSQAAAEAALGIDLAQPGDPGFAEPAGVMIVGEHKYENVLPSLNVNYLATDDIIVRFAASKTIARPPFDDLRPGFNFQESVFNPATDLRLGNPRLEPFESTNLDLSFEWYFDEQSLLSIAFFDKQLDRYSRGVNSVAFFADPRSFLYDANGIALPEDQVNTPPLSDLILGISDPQPLGCLPNREFDYGALVGPAGCEVVNVNSLENGSGGYVRGAEIGLQHNFSYLPGILSGTGVIANYTYADSETDENTVLDEAGNVIALTRAGPLENTSLHTFNATAFYEKDGLQLRLAYNTRSDYLVNSAQTGGYSVYAEGGESLDFSGGYDLTENLRLNFSAVNLLDDIFRTYAVVNSGEFERSDPAFAATAVANPLPREPLALGDQPTHRTLRRSNTGSIFRIGLRYEF